MRSATGDGPPSDAKALDGKPSEGRALDAVPSVAFASDELAAEAGSACGGSWEGKVSAGGSGECAGGTEAFRSVEPAGNDPAAAGSFRALPEGSGETPMEMGLPGGGR